MRKAIQLCVALFFSTVSIGWGQTKIQILSSDITDITKGKSNTRTYYLRGNVGLKQDVAYMYCDSAVLRQPENTFEAYGNVRIIQSDTVRINGKELFYSGDERVFTIKKDVVLTTPSSRLATTVLRYDRNNATAYYLTRSTLERNTLRLTSDVGSYNTDVDLVKLRGDVVAVDSSFLMNTDTLLYYPERNVYDFAGPTTMIRDSTTLFCQQGTYEADQTLLRLEGGASMISPGQFIKASTLTYNLKGNSGELKGHGLVADTAQGFVLEGEYIEYIKSPVFVDAYYPVYYRQDMDGDTLYSKGDTLHIREDSLGYKNVVLRDNTQFFSADFQGISPNFNYSEGKEELALYPSPTLWSDKNQFASDSAALTLREEHLDSLFMVGTVRIASQTDDSAFFDQTTGKYLRGNFVDGQLQTIRLDGNAQNFLHNVNGGKAVGLNNSTCSWLQLNFEEGTVNRIRMAKDVQATYRPIDDGGPQWLEDCKPNFELRPEKINLRP